jgi:hypothetical protein
MGWLYAGGLLIGTAAVAIVGVFVAQVWTAARSVLPVVGLVGLAIVAGSNTQGVVNRVSELGNLRLQHFGRDELLADSGVAIAGAVIGIALLVIVLAPHLLRQLGRRLVPPTPEEPPADAMFEATPEPPDPPSRPLLPAYAIGLFGLVGSVAAHVAPQLSGWNLDTTFQLSQQAAYGVTVGLAALALIGAATTERWLAPLLLVGLAYAGGSIVVAAIGSARLEVFLRALAMAPLLYGALVVGAQLVGALVNRAAFGALLATLTGGAALLALAAVASAFIAQPGLGFRFAGTPAEVPLPPAVPAQVPAFPLPGPCPTTILLPDGQVLHCARASTSVGGTPGGILAPAPTHSPG